MLQVKLGFYIKSSDIWPDNIYLITCSQEVVTSLHQHWGLHLMVKVCVQTFCCSPYRTHVVSLFHVRSVSFPELGYQTKPIILSIVYSDRFQLSVLIGSQCSFSQQVLWWCLHSVVFFSDTIQVDVSFCIIIRLIKFKSNVCFLTCVSPFINQKLYWLPCISSFSYALCNNCIALVICL